MNLKEKLKSYFNHFIVYTKKIILEKFIGQFAS